MRSPGFIPFPGDIKIAITASELLDIPGAVLTGANNVFILLPIPGGQPARAAHIPVAFLVDQEALEQLKNPFLILIEKKSLGFLDLFQ
jgi:hypothetical protein